MGALESRLKLEPWPSSSMAFLLIPAQFPCEFNDFTDHDDRGRPQARTLDLVRKCGERRNHSSLLRQSCGFNHRGRSVGRTTTHDELQRDVAYAAHPHVDNDRSITTSEL